MYDELVKRLREFASIPEHCENVDNCDKCSKEDICLSFTNKRIIEVATQAADAIEELSKPHWIPVAERLPNGEAERYLVAASLMSFGLRVSICYYADSLEEVDEYDFKDEKHSGFYGYDDEYGYYERSGVRYWMPLPEPPKEET